MNPLILIIDDEVRYRELYSETLKQNGFEVVTAASAEDARKFLARQKPAMVISDVRMPGVDGLTFLNEVKEKYPDLPFLLITAFADIRDAVKALKLGAVDYLEKPVDLDELLTAVEDSLEVFADETVQQDLPAHVMKGIIAENPDMCSLFADAYRVAKSDANVLITGESGSGKEVLAKFIHDCSQRSSLGLVTLNCAAIPANMLASELFGHQKGAFTGALNHRKGLFREADQGTLFLDEIGDMPLELQPSMLRAIETGKITPLGSDKEVTVDIRLIAATNRKLSEDVQAGKFREDLYYRLNVIAFEIPPLRERPEDILPMARHFLSLKNGGNKRFSPATARILQSYPWPGNTRELANAMERASILANTEVILPEHLPPALAKQAMSQSPEMNSDTQTKTIMQVEFEAIRKALDTTNGNRTKAAELLGISRRTLIYKLKRMQ